jgi:hypothetical protein
MQARKNLSIAKLTALKSAWLEAKISACNESETTKQTVKLYVIKTFLRFLLPDIL